MKRTFMLVVGTVVVLALAAGVYVMMQPAAAPPPGAVQRLATQQLPATTAPATQQAVGVVHPGENLWVKVPDEKTGALALQFRAARYEPQPDNSLNVTQPQAEFYFTNGQVVSIEGSHGRVVIPGDATQSSDLRFATAPPSRGELYDVTISLFNAGNLRRPAIVCRVNNVAFDNDTFRIATEAFTAPDGKHVPADQVPIQLRGQEYDFNGRGLTIRWNDRDRRLQMLEIAHGESLTIKSPQFLQERQASTARSARTTTASARPAPRQAAAAPRAETPPTQPAATQPVYQANFEGPVRAVQGGRQLMLAESLRVDFRMEEQDSDAPPATAPTRRRPTTSAPAPATTRPATAPAAPEPVILRWKGKLVIAPAEHEVAELRPGEMNIELASTKSAVELHYAGVDVRCGSCLYLAGGRGAEVRNSESVPLISMKDARGAQLQTTGLIYDGPAGKAFVRGQSRTEMPLKQQDGSVQLLSADWNKECVLTMAGQAQNNLVIEQAEISGDVKIEHPRLKLVSQMMRVLFAPSQDAGADSVQLKEVVASGQVQCALIDEQNNTQHVHADKLTVETAPDAANELRPRVVTAEGNVHSFDEGNTQEIRAGHLVATLAPATRPSDPPRIERFMAQRDVQFRSGEAHGRADQLIAVPEGDDYDVKLSGQPFATVAAGDSSLAGAIIGFKPRRQELQVVGAGTLRGMLRETPDAKPSPFELAWDSGLEFEGAADRAEVNGNVAFTTTSRDGSRNTASGDKLTLALMEGPKKPGAPATTRSAETALDLGGLNGKTLRTLSLEGNTKLDSTLLAADGKLLRRVYLAAPTLRVDGPEQRVVIPAAGRMLFEDFSPVARGPATAPARLGDFSGATAFEWQRELIFDQARGRTEMLGGVVIVHEAANAGNSPPFRLEAEQVSADLEKQTAAATRTTGGLADVSSAADVKRVAAEGGVRFISGQVQFDAAKVWFDPAEEILAAIGDGRSPVQVYDSQGRSTGSFEEVWWNTRTQQIKRLRNVQATIRR